MSRYFDDLGSDYVVIPRPRFIQEHVKLIKVLDNAKPAELKAEREDQAKELRAELRKKKSKSKNKHAREAKDKDCGCR